MSSEIPTSCADLDLAAVERELIRAGANVSAAAKSFGVPVHDLRVLTRALPRLIEVALEAEELRLDEAQETLLEALRVGPLRRRIRAAGFILRMSGAARRRGWGPRGSSRDEPVEPQSVTLKWIDT
jgi:hypothetical protein